VEAQVLRQENRHQVGRRHPRGGVAAARGGGAADAIDAELGGQLLPLVELLSHGWVPLAVGAALSWAGVRVCPRPAGAKTRRLARPRRTILLAPAGRLAGRASHAWPAARGGRR